MKGSILYIIGRWYEARSARAIRKYFAMKDKAEKYFRKVGL